MPNTFELIASSTVGLLGAADITFSSIPNTYTDLCVKLSIRTNRAAGNDALYISVNGSTNLNNRIIEAVGSGTPDSYPTSGASLKPAAVNAATSTSSTFGSAEFYFPSYAGSANKSFSVDSATENNSSSAIIVLSANIWNSTSAITSLSFTSGFGTGFLQYSTAYLYGVKNA
jgi:hypothetical protein